MGGDFTACPFLVIPRWGLVRCQLRIDPQTLRPRETECAGLPGRCSVPELREREIRRRDQERHVNDRPVSLLVRLARRAVGRW